MTLKTVNTTTFEALVLTSSLPVIVLFGTKGKKSSDQMTASLETAAQSHVSEITFLEKAFEKDGSIETDPQYDVQSAPTTLFFKDGKLERTVVGFYLYEGVFKAWVDELAQA
ncbi:thioredoxin family protein [Pseudomonas uvaldensis]|uniref:thioredoxin family protein n=1 Tax=Pseudomonas uvaldensis TaxID=2878385 RepID=UPI001E470ABC|nr:thioredoxin domain-containing protein [Pseudomonas uvaldensis]MCE0463106.1 thioredoxin family protein [Pseudomonas uvaldensis]